MRLLSAVSKLGIQCPAHAGPDLSVLPYNAKTNQKFYFCTYCIHYIKSVSKVLGKMSDSRTSYIASVTIIQRAG